VPAKSQRGSVSAKDIVLERFCARALELVRLTAHKDAERFARTALSDEIITYLAKFFADLTKIRQGSGITRQSAEVSTEQRTAEHAALDEAGA
jgi:Mn-dependent DtxR family transcriptional regulator